MCPSAVSPLSTAIQPTPAGQAPFATLCPQIVVIIECNHHPPPDMRAHGVSVTHCFHSPPLPTFPFPSFLFLTRPWPPRTSYYRQSICSITGGISQHTAPWHDACCCNHRRCLAVAMHRRIKPRPPCLPPSPSACQPSSVSPLRTRARIITPAKLEKQARGEG